MLIGTLLLGVLLGFLIWGWLRKKVNETQSEADKWKHISDLRQVQIVDLTTLNTSLQEKMERTETRITLADFRLRKSQEEVEVLRAELAFKQQESHQTLFDINMSEDRRSGSDREIVQMTPEEEPTLADITKAMETGMREKPVTEQSETPIEPRQAALHQGSSDASMEMARSIFDGPIDPDDLKVVYGIDQKMEEILHRAGVKTWTDLALSRLPDLRRIVEDAGPRYRDHDPKTWAIQARMAAKGEWKKLRAYQETLSVDED